MDKNTILAVVLSTLVIIGGVFLTPLIQAKFSKNKAQPVVETETVAENTVKNEENSSATVEAINDSLFTEADEESIEEIENEIEETLVTVDIGVAQVTLTNKGGDLVSYKLNKYTDTETGDSIQISDNVTNDNRTFSISLGNAETDPVDGIFEYEKVDEYTHRFYKNFNMKDSSGTKKPFVLAKTYTFKPEEYMFKLDVVIKCADNTGVDFNGAAYTIRTSPQIGPKFDVKDRYDIRQFIAFNGKKCKKTPVGSNIGMKDYKKEVLWGGIAGKYFVELVIPSDPTIWTKASYSSKVVNETPNAQAFFERKSFTGTVIEDSYYMYFGPRSNNDLKKYTNAEKNSWNYSGNKLTECLNSMGFLSWLEFLLRKALELLHLIIPNWGICIIVLTILIRFAMFPLSKKQSMSTLKMQELQPKIKQIQEKYATDQRKQQEEMSKVYKEAGYNPAAGCLPLILTFLILISMYSLFNNYFEFRGAKFIPGWIPDLSKADSVATLGFNIPLLGNKIRILPIIYVASQILFSIFTQNGGASAGQSGKMMKFMTYGMPILFFFMFYSAPAGLLLYWITSNVFQLFQQLAINKMMRAKRAAAETPAKVQKVLPPKAKRK